MKKERTIYIAFFTWVILILFLLSFFFCDFLFVSASENASVSFVILDTGAIVIESPLNTTYNFNGTAPYVIDLNVSTIGFTADKWWYTLFDLTHNVTINDSVFFIPNSTIGAVRWANRLYVYANSSSSGAIKSVHVDFFINVSNSAPILGNINSSIFVCEGQSLNYDFNATDIDEDAITIGISPTNPFFVNPIFFSGVVHMNSSIISGVLTKNDTGLHEETVSISDGEYVDTADTNITVIEINNAPVVENIGVHTIWFSGDDSTFYEQVNVTDIEDGDQDSVNITFTISFSGDYLFNISSGGVMNFTPDNSSQIGVHNITVCVNDTGIDSPHPDIFAECGQDGGPIKVCQSFSLTVTDQNRAPTIVDHHPFSLQQNINEGDVIIFDITKYDPDATIPDAYWYVNGVLKQYDSGNSTDFFNYNFPCSGSFTLYTLKAEITDGLLNDSLAWNINVSCDDGNGGSGGGGGSIRCYSLWACEEWNTCENAGKLLVLGILSGEEYRNISEQCEAEGLDYQMCGAQIRKCSDLNNCSTGTTKPIKAQFCYYTDDPTCNDSIKNCHHGSCELLVDCGGPCEPCPTCSDGIQNQGEEGIDCGGPCAWKCGAEKPLMKKKWFLFFLWLLLLLLLLILIIIIIRILESRKELDDSKKKKMFPLFYKKKNKKNQKKKGLKSYFW